jgi:CBS domain-containing protein
MRHHVTTVAPEESIARVAAILLGTGISGIPVVEGNRIVGIITEGDLVAREADIDFPARTTLLDAMLTLDAGRPYAEEVRKVLAITARDLMTSPVFNILDHATLQELATLMIEENVNPVPVVNQEHHLVGIVSRTDLVRYIAEFETADSDERNSPS